MSTTERCYQLKRELRRRMMEKDTPGTNIGPNPNFRLSLTNWVSLV